MDSGEIKPLHNRMWKGSYQSGIWYGNTTSFGVMVDHIRCKLRSSSTTPNTRYTRLRLFCYINISEENMLRLPVIFRISYMKGLFYYCQGDTKQFNSAALLNIGYVESRKMAPNYVCIRFHDVESTRKIQGTYTCVLICPYQ